MLTCIACTKQINGGCLHQQQHEDDDEDTRATPRKKQSIKTITTHIKGMALKASGAYKNCKPCSKGGKNSQSEYEESNVGNSALLSKRFNYGYHRPNSIMGGIWGKGKSSVGARVVVPSGSGLGTGHSCGEATPVSVSGRSESVVFSVENEPKEWIAQVEPGVLINFVSMPQGGNDLKRIRFSRELFNKWQAQRWWAENYDKLMELYNVQSFNPKAVQFPTPPLSEDDNSKFESLVGGSPVTPPLSKESLPRTFHQQAGIAYSSSDSLDHHASRQHCESYGLVSTPKLSNTSMKQIETSSVDASARSSFSRTDHSGDELSVISNASEVEAEWVEQDEPGVYITIRALPNGIRELRRVRFSRERFEEMHARLWWEENKTRIQEQYL